MSQKYSIIVNYKNALGLWHLSVEQLVVTDRNNYIKPADFASWIAERYIAKGCSEVVCVEFNRPKITKSGLKCLAETDVSFITEKIKDDLGQRWEFRKEPEPAETGSDRTE